MGSLFSIASSSKPTSELAVIDLNQFNSSTVRLAGRWMVNQFVNKRIEKKEAQIQSCLNNFAISFLRNTTHLPMRNFNPFSSQKSVTSIAKSLSKEAAPGLTKGAASLAKFIGCLMVEVMIDKLPLD